MKWRFIPVTYQTYSLIINNLDASGFRLGVFDVTNQFQFSRQLSLSESKATDICGYEALAIKFALLNLDLHKKPTRIM